MGAELSSSYNWGKGKRLDLNMFGMQTLSNENSFAKLLNVRVHGKIICSLIPAISFKRQHKVKNALFIHSVLPAIVQMGEAVCSCAVQPGSQKVQIQTPA